mmetsp:Transcript_81582/g.228824  ORF Transcript_81582/g.228824 Transcript_81582/m.228824 type:complete len:515 (-) Transcript_81582:207-1751(-)
MPGAARPRNAAAAPSVSRPAQRGAPQDLGSALCAVEGDVKRLSKCLDEALGAKTASEAERLHHQMSELRAVLQEHRTHIRKRMTEVSAKSSCKEKLSLTRTHIEQELRRLADFERSHAAPAEGAVCGAGLDAESSVHPHRDVGEGIQDAGDSVSGEGAHPAEVKVQRCQLVKDGSQEADIAEEFVCKICLDVVGEGPKLTRCTHLFCGTCIKRWFEVHPESQSWAVRAQAKGRVPCPVCKETLCESADLHAVCPGGEGDFLWKVLCSLRVRCVNHFECGPDGRCDWIGDYGSFQAHVKTCKNEPAQPQAQSTADASAGVVPAEVVAGPEGDGAASPASVEEPEPPQPGPPPEVEEPPCPAEVAPEQALTSLPAADLDAAEGAVKDTVAGDSPLAELSQERPASPAGESSSDESDDADLLDRLEEEFAEEQRLLKQQEAQLHRKQPTQTKAAKEAQRQAYLRQMAAQAQAVRASQMAYAAQQWQAAQWQAAYAAQWQAAYMKAFDGQTRAAWGGM